MIDISKKIRTERIAKAQAIVRIDRNILEKIKNNEIPKGNVFETAKISSIIGVKKTSDLIPFCHNLPIEWVSTEFYILDDKLKIVVTVKTTYKTGCEMEALTGASCAALTVYDMVKPLTTDIEIESISLIEKKGGKSSMEVEIPDEFKAAVIVISDSVSQGTKEDISGKVIEKFLTDYNIKDIKYIVIPDDLEKIKNTINEFCKKEYNLIITTGGTGVSKRDLTPEGVKPLLEREIPGISEILRYYGSEKNPYSMFSRGIAGVKGKTLIITLPGSKKAVEESLNILFPYLFHFYPMFEGKGH